MISIDESSIAHLQGVVKIIHINNFVGVVAEREEQEIEAMHQLKIKWNEWQRLPDLTVDKPHDTLDALSSQDRE